ncbi:unnamed protein product [Prunus armeniaca]
MRIMKKSALLPTPEEPISIDKLHGIPHAHSPPTPRLGGSTEKVDPCQPTRKSISVTQIVKLTHMTHKPCAQRMSRSL